MNEELKILEKLKKLQRFYDSAKSINSEEEANNAALLIQNILFEYNLSIEDINLTEDAEENKLVTHHISNNTYKFIGGKWKNVLIGVVSRYNFCRGYFNRKCGKESFMVVGRKEDTEVVLWLYNFLCESFVKLGKNRFIEYSKFQDENGYRKIGIDTFLRSYLLGCVSGIEMRFEKEKKIKESENVKVTALVLKNDILFNEYESKLNLKNARKVYVDRGAGYFVGVVDGENISLKKPLLNNDDNNDIKKLSI